MPKVSVITTVYNGERYIIKTIDSVLKQEYEDYEMVIVDDASTDSTASIIKQIKDDRIIFLEEQHMGRPKALNYAISNSKGKYVAILDADDIALPKRLAVQTTYLDRHPNIGLVSSGKIVFIDGKGNIVRREERTAYSNRDIRQALCFTNPLFHSSVMYRREVFDKVNGYDEKLPCLVDMDFYVRSAPHCELVNIPEYLSYKREHDDQYFGGVVGVHKSTKIKRARAKILYRTVFYLNGPKTNLLRALKLYLMSFL